MLESWHSSISVYIKYITFYIVHLTKHIKFKHVNLCWFYNFTSTESINFSKSWWTVTLEGTGGVYADVVMARARIRFAFVHVLLTRFPGPPWFANTPLYTVTCQGAAPTFARGFTVFSIEKIATGYIVMENNSSKQYFFSLIKIYGSLRSSVNQSTKSTHVRKIFHHS